VLENPPHLFAVVDLQSVRWFKHAVHESGVASKDLKPGHSATTNDWRLETEDI